MGGGRVKFFFFFIKRQGLEFFPPVSKGVPSAKSRLALFAGRKRGVIFSMSCERGATNHPFPSKKVNFFFIKRGGWSFSLFLRGAIG